MNIVPATGPSDAKIMLVGEAPGAEEDRIRKPFVGSAGRKLDECLHTAQLSRTGLYITNVVKERPPGNNIDSFISFGRGAPKVSEKFLSYVDILKAEIEKLKPNVVCALGNTALYALTGETSISNWRGSIMESTLVPGVKVIPTIHPAAALRQHLFTHEITHDLIKVKRESEYPELRLPNPTMKLKPTLSEALEYLNECKARGICAVDIEVVSQEIECLAFAKNSLDSCCIVLYDGGPVFTEEEEVVLWCKIDELLSDPAVVKIFQNAAFDVTFIFERYDIMTVNIEDTMIQQGLLTPDMPKSLAFIGSIYTDYPYYKGEGKEWYKNPAGSPEGFWKYNCLDTLVTFDAYVKLKEDIERIGLTETYRSHLGIIEALVWIQHNGIKMDAARMKEAAKKAEERISELQTELNALAGMPLNPNSPKQLMNYFYVNKRIKPFSKGGKITTDEKAMLKIALAGHKEAAIVLEIRGLKKLKSTYLEVKLDNGRLKCAANPIGTSTGRISTSQSIFGMGTNMQNQPHSMYEFMYVDEGKIGCNLDLAGADSRVVAFCGPVPIMKDAYERGVDVHSLTASLIFGIPMDMVSRVDGSSPLGSGKYSQRYWGKKMNHSSNYGIGKNELSYRLEITPREAQTLLDAYHSAYPEVRSGYQAQIIQALRNGRKVTNPFGRCRLFLDRWGESLFQQAYGFFAQSTVADIINRWGLIKLLELRKSFDITIINQVHDSIVFYMPKDKPGDYATVCNELKASLEQPIHWRNISFSVPAEFELLRTSFADRVELKAPFTEESIQAAIAN